MGNLVCGGAVLKCSFGNLLGNLTVIPKNRVVTSTPIANILDNIPMVNISFFGMCSSLANPAVASATTAALGVLTPAPCIPVIAAPWTPGCVSVLIANMPALNNSSKCMCSWGGIIEISMPGEMNIQIP